MFKVNERLDKYTIELMNDILASNANYISINGILLSAFYLGKLEGKKDVLEETKKTLEGLDK